MEKRDNGDTVAQYTMGARGALEAQRRAAIADMNRAIQRGDEPAYQEAYDTWLELNCQSLGAAYAAPEWTE